MRKKIYNSDSRYLTRQMASDDLNLGLQTVDRIALEAQAKLKIGKSVRYDIEKMRNYINNHFTVEN